MAISEFASGTRTAGTPPEGSPTAIGGTDNTTDGIFQVFVDCNALQAADGVEIQCLEKAISGGTQRVIFTTTLIGIQDEPLFASPSFILMHGWQFNIRQIYGTARSFPWSVRQVA